MVENVGFFQSWLLIFEFISLFLIKKITSGMFSWDDEYDDPFLLRDPFKWGNFPRRPAEPAVPWAGSEKGFTSFEERVRLDEKVRCVDEVDTKKAKIPVYRVDSGETLDITIRPFAIHKVDSRVVFLSENAAHAVKVQTCFECITELKAFAIIELTANTDEARRWSQRHEGIRGLPIVPLVAYSLPFLMPEMGYRMMCATVTEFFDKGSVERVAGTVYIKTAVDMFKDVIAGLEYLHTVCRFLHGDLKLGNICITSTGRFVLIDLGLARDFLDKSGNIRGNEHTDRVEANVGYSEDLHLKRRLCPKSEIAAAALAFFMIMAGTRPVVHWAQQPVIFELPPQHRVKSILRTCVFG